MREDFGASGVGEEVATGEHPHDPAPSRARGRGRQSESLAAQAARTSAAWMKSYLRRAAAGDFLCAALAAVLTLWVRFLEPGYLPVLYISFSSAFPFLWMGSIALAGGYDSRFIGIGPDEFRRIAVAALGLTAGIAIVSYALKLDIARGYVALAIPLAALSALSTRYLLRKHLHRLRRRGQCMRRVLVVGHDTAINELAEDLRRSVHHGMSVVGACVVGNGRLPDDAVRVSGGLDCVPAALNRFAADTVAVLACPEIDGTQLRGLAWELEKTGTDLCVAPALVDIAGPRTTIRPAAGLPILHMNQPELRGTSRLIKAAIDRLTAALALLALLPAFAAIALAIRAGDLGPVFFRQTRVGRNGRTFRVWKFRTMVRDAEQRQAQLAALNEAAGVLFKMRHDPRVTPVGAWLRRWSLDELPQLFNVLSGDMSLVGPRPAVPEEVARYEHVMRRRLKVKPGITGLWQVSGRSDLPWDEAVRLDIRYVENWSPALDVQIVLKTLSAIIHRSGAY